MKTLDIIAEILKIEGINYLSAFPTTNMIESAAKKNNDAITTIIKTVIVLVSVSLLVAQVILDISPLTCLTNLAGLVLAIS